MDFDKMIELRLQKMCSGNTIELPNRVKRPVIDFSEFWNNFRTFDVIAKRTVYLLFNSGEVVYVGISEKTPQRISTHRRDGNKDWDAMAFVPCGDASRGRMLDFENYLIKHYKPKYNKTGK